MSMPTLFAGNRFGLSKSTTEKSEEKIVKTIPVFKADRLLLKKKHRQLIEQCSQLLDFEEEHINIYITPLIHSFVEFIQYLPETRNSYFSKPGGLLDHALMRSASALSMCRAYFSAQASDKNNTRLSTTETLWMYALFSASIFNGIGKIFSDLTVELYDEDNKHIDRWNPFKGDMLTIKKAYAYDYCFEEARYIDLFSRRLSIVLAKQIMPDPCFAWLSTDKEVLSLWLALLEDNQRDAGTLGPFLVRADAMAINTYFDEKQMNQAFNALDLDLSAEEEKTENQEEKENRERSENRLEKEKMLLRFSATFGSSEDKPAAGSENEKAQKRNANTQGGIEFLKWLTNQLKSNQLNFNEGVFYMPAGAIFLPTPLFEEFRRKHPFYKSHLDVIAEFNKLQLHVKNKETNDMHTFVRQNTADGAKKIQGIILSNGQLILPKKVNIRLTTGQTHAVEATELPQCSHLLEPLQPVGSAKIHTEKATNHSLFRR